jgi:hypothetical protein
VGEGGDGNHADLTGVDATIMLVSAPVTKKLYAGRVERASGSGSVSYTNTHGTIGALDSGAKYLTGDIAEILIFRPVNALQKLVIETYLAEKYGLRTCGDSDSVYLEEDVNQDCYVDLKDFAFVGADWMQCTDPTNPDCD